MPVSTVNDKRITARTNPLVTSWSQKSSRTNTPAPSPSTVAIRPATRVANVTPGPRATLTGAAGGGSTPASGSVSSRSPRRGGRSRSRRKSSTNGSAGRSPVASTLSVGSNPARTACSTPSPMPPTTASGTLTRRPTTQAASAATSRVKKWMGTSSANSGASRTPVSPASVLDKAQAIVDTRSASTPASWVIRALSTTARIRSPRPDQRSNNVSPTTTTPVDKTVTTCPASRT